MSQELYLYITNEFIAGIINTGNGTYVDISENNIPYYLYFSVTDSSVEYGTEYKIPFFKGVCNCYGEFFDHIDSADGISLIDKQIEYIDLLDESGIISSIKTRCNENGLGTIGTPIKTYCVFADNISSSAIQYFKRYLSENNFNVRPGNIYISELLAFSEEQVSPYQYGNTYDTLVVLVQNQDIHINRVQVSPNTVTRTKDNDILCNLGVDPTIRIFATKLIKDANSYAHLYNTAEGLSNAISRYITTHNTSIMDSIEQLRNSGHTEYFTVELEEGITHQIGVAYSYIEEKTSGSVNEIVIRVKALKKKSNADHLINRVIFCGDIFQNIIEYKNGINKYGINDDIDVLIPNFELTSILAHTVRVFNEKAMVNISSYVDKNQYENAINILEEVVKYRSNDDPLHEKLATYKESYRLQQETQKLSKVNLREAEELERKGCYEAALGVAEKCVFEDALEWHDKLCKLKARCASKIDIYKKFHKKILSAKGFLGQRRFNDARTRALEADQLIPNQQDFNSLINKIDTQLNLQRSRIPIIIKEIESAKKEQDYEKIINLHSEWIELDSNANGVIKDRERYINIRDIRNKILALLKDSVDFGGLLKLYNEWLVLDPLNNTIEKDIQSVQRCQSIVVEIQSYKSSKNHKKIVELCEEWCNLMPHNILANKALQSASDLQQSTDTRISEIHSRILVERSNGNCIELEDLYAELFELRTLGSEELAEFNDVKISNSKKRELKEKEKQIDAIIIDGDVALQNNDFAKAVELYSSARALGINLDRIAVKISEARIKESEIKEKLDSAYIYAKEKFESKDYRESKRFIIEGLLFDPDNEVLKKLQESIDKAIRSQNILETSALVALDKAQKYFEEIVSIGNSEAINSKIQQCKKNTSIIDTIIRANELFHHGKLEEAKAIYFSLNSDYGNYKVELIDSIITILNHLLIIENQLANSMDVKEAEELLVILENEKGILLQYYKPEDDFIIQVNNRLSYLRSEVKGKILFEKGMSEYKANNCNYTAALSLLQEALKCLQSNTMLGIEVTKRIDAINKEIRSKIGDIIIEVKSLIKTNKIDEALQAITEGLNIDVDNDTLLRLKGEIKEKKIEQDEFFKSEPQQIKKSVGGISKLTDKQKTESRLKSKKTIDF